MDGGRGEVGERLEQRTYQRGYSVYLSGQNLMTCAGVWTSSLLTGSKDRCGSGDRYRIAMSDEQGCILGGCMVTKTRGKGVLVNIAAMYA